MSRPLTFPGALDLSARPDADVLAAGAVLYRSGAGREVTVAVVHRPRYDDWSLPKGKVDRGESLPATAVREVLEETGCSARLQHALGDVHYTVAEGRKAVRYWSAQAVAVPEFAAGDETDVLRWLPPIAADALLTHDHDRGILQRFVAAGPPSSVVLLVRHAKAGSRKQWNGADADRPLSSTGHDQISRLTALLPAFGPDRIHSAPSVRCRDSVLPLARALAGRIETVDGCTVADEPLLAEEGYRAEPDAALARFRELAARPGVTVVCSQGGVIPQLVGALLPGSALAAGRARRGFFLGPDLPARKASTWLLALHDGTLTRADHYPRPTA